MPPTDKSSLTYHLDAPSWKRGLRHPLQGVQLSRRLQVSLLCQPINPMAQAVNTRSKLMEMGYSVLLMSPSRMLIANPERPNRYEEYDIAQAQRLMEKLYE